MTQAAFNSLPPGFELDGVDAQTMAQPIPQPLEQGMDAMPAPSLPDGFVLDEAPASAGPQRSNLAEKVGIESGQVQVPRSDASLPFLQGVMLNSADEILPAIGAPIAAAANRLGLLQGDALPGVGDNYDQGQALLRAQQARMEAEHPLSTIGLEVAGGLATAKLPVGVVAKGGGVAAKVGRGAATGAGYGAVAGFNDGEGMTDRIDQAVTGAAVGGLVGAFAPVAARAVGKAYGAVAQKIQNGRIAGELGTGTRVVRDAAAAYADDAANGLLKPGDSADLLLNRGPSLQVMAETLANQPGEARGLLIRAIQSQQADAGRRTRAVVDATMGRDAGNVANLASVEVSRKAAGELYNAARAYPGRFDTKPLADELFQLMAETDGPVRAVLQRVRRLQVFSSGAEGASATQLHAARQAIDDLAQHKDLGGNSYRLLQTIRGQFDRILKDNVPGWAQADEAYSAAMNRKTALANGREVFTRSYGSPDELAAEIRGMKPAERADFLRGARASISELMGTARRDATAVQNQLLHKSWGHEKLAVLVGASKAKALTFHLEREAARQQAAQNVLGNSRTALRQATAKAYSPNGGERDLKGASMTGLAMTAVNKVWNALNADRRNQLSRQAAKLLSMRASDVEPLIREAASLAGRRLNVREQIEVVAQRLAFSAANPAAQSAGLPALSYGQTGQ